MSDVPPVTDTEIIRRKRRTFTEGILYWKLAVTKCTGKALMAGINSIVATLNGVEWNTFTPTQKFVAFMTAAGAMWLVMDAFLDQTMSRLSEADKKAIATETS